jgi:hypothetical protein
MAGSYTLADIETPPLTAPDTPSEAAQDAPLLYGVYNTSPVLRSAIQVDDNDTSDITNQRLMAALTAASRWIDGFCGRYFFSVRQVRYFDIVNVLYQNVDDLLSADAVAFDVAINGEFQQPWVEGTNFYFYPESRWPKRRLKTSRYRVNTLFLGIGPRNLRIIGTWGYGDGRTATPWSADLQVTLTVADAESATVTASDDGIEAGMTIRAGAEDMLVKAVAADGVALTVVRGINGSTAEIHAADPVFRALYPEAISEYCLYRAALMYHSPGQAGMLTEMIGAYRYQAFVPQQLDQHALGWIGRYRRIGVR